MPYFDTLIDLCQQQCFLCGNGLPPPASNGSTGHGMTVILLDKYGQECESDERLCYDCFMKGFEEI